MVWTDSLTPSQPCLWRSTSSLRVSEANALPQKIGSGSKQHRHLPAPPRISRDGLAMTRWSARATATARVPSTKTTPNNARFVSQSYLLIIFSPPPHCDASHGFKLVLLTRPWAVATGGGETMRLTTGAESTRDVRGTSSVHLSDMMKDDPSYSRGTTKLRLYRCTRSS